MKNKYFSVQNTKEKLEIDKDTYLSQIFDSGRAPESIKRMQMQNT